MKNFFTRKSLRGKISILTIITSLLAMFLVIGAVFSLKHQRYSKDELFKFKAQAELLARTLGSLHPTPAELRDTGLDFFFQAPKPYWMLILKSEMSECLLITELEDWGLSMDFGHLLMIEVRRGSSPARARLM
ncbi:hypothetical protein OAH46_02570 [Verrucomicrobia bacterium]|nr:hypothetical protein [Verrucomicrobiota bacterium]